MRRRQTAAPLDPVEGLQTDLTATEEVVTIASTDAPGAVESPAPPDMSEAETAPAKPRRTRRPKPTPDTEATDAVIVAVPPVMPEAESADAVVADAVKTPRPRRPRKPAATAEIPTEVLSPLNTAGVAEPATTDPVTVDDISREPSPVAVASVDIETVFADADGGNDPAVLEVAEFPALEASEDAALSDLLAESEAILDEVLSETGAESQSARSRRNRRGRGRGRGASADGGETNAELPAPDDGLPIRKRGPRLLARTVPLPALAVTPDAEIVLPESVAPLQIGRKRGIRTPVTMRRILTPNGVTVVSAAQADTLLSSAVLIPVMAGVPGDAPQFVPLAPAAIVPEYAPLPIETLERLPKVSVAPTNGVPELSVNETPVLPAFLFVNTEVADEPEVAREIAARQIRRAYAAGVRLFTLLAHLPWRRKSGDRRTDSLDAALALVAENAPDALVLPRFIFSPPMSWERTNPDEMALYSATDEPGDVSIGSDAFWQEEAKDALRAAVEHLARHERSANVLGVYLEHGEWFHPKGVGADYSPANIAAFRAYLRGFYSNSEVALRAAWYDGSVTFDTAGIPTESPVTASASASQPVFLGERETRIADFHRYTSQITADRIIYLAQVAKEASAGRLAVAASYGYTLEIARPNCGHYALANVLASPDVDILTAPLSYSGRLPGGSAPPSVPVDSVHLAGKLFVCEDDTKTHLALRPTGDDYNPKLETESDTRAVHARNIGTAIAKGCGVSWMDLWGEGWLDDDATWEHLGSLVRVMSTAADLRRKAAVPVAAPQVAVFVDEESLFDVVSGVGNEEPALLAGLVGRHRDLFARAGASVGYYLLSDLLKPNFPESPVLFLFLNAFRLPLAIRTVLQARWQSAGRTFAWLFAPGVRETGNIAELGETVGVQLRLQPWGSRTGTVVTDGRFVLTENAKGERFGEDKRVNPSLTVADPKAQVLGEYVISGNPSLAYRKHARWQSVFIGEREMPLPLLRGLYRLAGVNVVTDGDDAVSVAGDGFVSLHCLRDASITLYSPTRAESTVYDAASGELLAGTGFGARAESFARVTRLLFFVGNADVAERFEVGPDAWETAPEPLLESDLPAKAKAFAFEAAPAPATGDTRQTARVTATAPPPGPQATRLYPVELSVSAEDIAQFEAALAGEIALLDKDDETGGESEASRKKRRRRRRRGDRTTEGAGTDGAETEESEGGTDTEETDADEETADAVFALADMTQSAMSFDADALLPLLSAENGAEDDFTRVSDDMVSSDGSMPLDPVADMMARLFAMPAVIREETGESEPLRPSLDELFSLGTYAPDKAEAIPQNTEDALSGESDTDDGELIDPQFSQTEPASLIEAVESGQESDAAEASDPESQGLLDGGGVRTRRTRSSAGAGGFAARLRRRAAERGQGGEGTVADEESQPGTEAVPEESGDPGV